MAPPSSFESANFPGTVSLESVNYPGYHWRHYGEAVYIASSGGGNAWDDPGGYNADVTWNNAAPAGLIHQHRRGRTAPPSGPCHVQVLTEYVEK